MLGTTFMVNRMAILLAGDTSSIGDPANAPAVHLCKVPFTPSPYLVLPALHDADFDGYALIHAVAGAQDHFIDPLTGDYVVRLIPIAGGWRWNVTGPANLPQTIYGYYLTDLGAGVLFGSGLFPEPIPLSGAGQAIEVATVEMHLLPSALM